MDERIRKYFENPRKIKLVKPLENYVLELTFDNGEEKRYEMGDNLTGVYAVLRNPEKFNSVFLDEVGNVAWDIDEKIDSTQHWENRIDLCKDALYLESEPVSGYRE